MIQHFFIEGRYFGQAPRGPIEFDYKQYGIPKSKVFVCPECSEAWARCPIEHDGRTLSFSVSVSCCRKCKPISGLHVPGSIWHHEAEFVAAFPDAVLRWEFLRHLDFLERTHEQPPAHNPR